MHSWVDWVIVHHLWRAQDVSVLVTLPHGNKNQQGYLHGHSQELPSDFLLEQTSQGQLIRVWACTCMCMCMCGDIWGQEDSHSVTCCQRPVSPSVSMTSSSSLQFPSMLDNQGSQWSWPQPLTPRGKRVVLGTLTYCPLTQVALTAVCNFGRDSMWARLNVSIDTWWWKIHKRHYLSLSSKQA